MMLTILDLPRLLFWICSEVALQGLLCSKIIIIKLLIIILLRRSKKHYFFKVNSSLQLMNATFVAIFLILLAGDFSRIPGPIPINIPEGIQVENVPVLISNRLNYSRFKQPSNHNVMVQRN